MKNKSRKIHNCANLFLTFFMVMIASCQLDFSHVDVTKMLSERTGKDVIMSVKSDTLIIKLKGTMDSVRHESLGNALNLIVIISIDKHFASFKKSILTVALYERENDISPLFVWTTDENDIHMKALQEQKFPERLNRLQFFVRNFTAKQLNSLDYICNTLLEYENQPQQGQGFFMFFFDTYVLCESKTDKVSKYIKDYFLENADSPEFCPDCNRAALEGFFLQCDEIVM